MTKRTIEEPLFIDIDGKTYQGYRIIEGTNKLYQRIYYGPLSKADGHPYKPQEGRYMEHIAKTILRELVQESQK